VHISFFVIKDIELLSDSSTTEIDVKQIGAAAVQDLREGSENEIS